MALVKIKKDVTKKDLWVFFAGLVVFAIVGYLLFSFKNHPILAKTALYLFGGSSGLFLLIPALRKKIYFGWIYLTYPIGLTISYLMLIILFYGVFMPIGLLVRLTGKDLLKKKIDRQAPTYWQTYAQPSDQARYFRQF